MKGLILRVLEKHKWKIQILTLIPECSDFGCSNCFLSSNKVGGNCRCFSLRHISEGTFQCEQRIIFFHFNIKDEMRLSVIFPTVRCIYTFLKAMGGCMLWRKSSRKEFFGTRLNDVRRLYRGQEAPFIFLCPYEYSVVETFYVKQMNFY